MPLCSCHPAACHLCVLATLCCAALQFPGYSGSCQRCYEVRCANQDIQDG